MIPLYCFGLRPLGTGAVAAVEMQIASEYNVIPLEIPVRASLITRLENKY